SPRASRENISGVEVVRSAYFGKLFSQPINPLFPIELGRLIPGYDVVHLHLPNPLAEASTLFCLNRSKVPLVLTYHSDIVRQKALVPLYGPLLKKVFQRANVVAAPTENHVKYSPFLNEFTNKCTMVPFGLEEHRFRLSSSVQEK